MTILNCTTTSNVLGGATQLTPEFTEAGIFPHAPVASSLLEDHHQQNEALPTNPLLRSGYELVYKLPMAPQ